MVVGSVDEMYQQLMVALEPRFEELLRTCLWSISDVLFCVPVTSWRYDEQLSHQVTFTPYLAPLAQLIERTVGRGGKRDGYVT